MAYRRVLRMMEDPEGMEGNIFDDELDEDGNAIQKGHRHFHLTGLGKRAGPRLRESRILASSGPGIFSLKHESSIF